MADLLDQINPIKMALGGFVDLLKGAGIIRDPEQEMKAKELAAKIEADSNEAFVDYIKATTPTSDRVYVWANTMIALVRPGLAVFLPLSFVLWTARWKEFMLAFGQLDLMGKILVAAPTLIFVGGRELMRMVVAILAGRTSGSPAAADILRDALPPGLDKFRQANDRN